MNIRFAARAATVIAALAASLAVGANTASADVGDPPQIVHVPVVVAPFDEPIEIVATGRCATATCSMTLGYRTSTGFTDISGETGPGDFTEVSMATADAQPVPDGSFTRDFDGTIPASVATTEGVDYYLHLTDGELETHFPSVAETLGEPLETYVPGYSHIEVLTRPTLTHVPEASYEPGEAIAVEAYFTASTPTPSVTLTYGTGGDDGRQTVNMVLRATAFDQEGVATAWTASASIPSLYTAAGTNIVYSLSGDDGYQAVTSPPSRDNPSFELHTTGTGAGDLTVSVGEYVVYPHGRIL